MRCPNCQQDNPAGNSVCVACGSQLEPETSRGTSSRPDASGTAAHQPSSLAQLEQRVEALELALRDTRATLSNYGGSPSAAQARQLQPGAKPQAPRRPPLPPAAPPAVEASRPKPALDVDWEFLVGGNWMARLGVVILVIGAGFFLKLAFDNN